MKKHLIIPFYNKGLDYYLLEFTDNTIKKYERYFETGPKSIQSKTIMYNNEEEYLKNNFLSLCSELLGFTFKKDQVLSYKDKIEDYNILSNLDSVTKKTEFNIKRISSTNKMFYYNDVYSRSRVCILGIYATIKHDLKKLFEDEPNFLKLLDQFEDPDMIYFYGDTDLYKEIFNIFRKASSGKNVMNDILFLNPKGLRYLHDDIDIQHPNLITNIDLYNVYKEKYNITKSFSEEDAILIRDTSDVDLALDIFVNRDILDFNIYGYFIYYFIMNNPNIRYKTITDPCLKFILYLISNKYSMKELCFSYVRMFYTQESKEYLELVQDIPLKKVISGVTFKNIKYKKTSTTLNAQNDFLKQNMFYRILNVGIY